MERADRDMEAPVEDLDRDEAAEDLVSDATRAAEDEEASVGARADREPTPDEERVADEVAGDVDPSVGKHYREMSEIGAEVEGEGRIAP